MAKSRKTRPHLPGDPPRSRELTLAERWSAWKVTIGAVTLYVIYKVIDLVFVRLDSLL